MHEMLSNIANEINKLGQINWLDIFSIIISGCSLLFAILIPVRISKTENKISLFEKRLNAYLEIMKLVRFCVYLQQNIKKNTIGVENSRIAKEITANFEIIFNCDTTSLDVQQLSPNVIKTIENNRIVVKSCIFLYNDIFKENINIDTEIDKIYDCLYLLIKNTIIKHSYTLEHINEYNKNITNFKNNYLDQLIDMLKMHKN